jgi:hypothetical protein
MSATSKINKLFADAAFASFQQKRFGLKNCNSKVNLDVAYDLLNLHIVLKNLSECDPEAQLSCCPLCVIEEKINTL